MPRFVLTQLQQFWQGRTKKLILGLLASLLLLLLISWLALPGYVKRLAIQQVQQQTGRKLEIAAISFSPLTLTLSATGLTLFEPDQTTAALTLKNAVLNLSASSLFHRALVMDEVRLEQPSVHLVRSSATNYGRYNFSDILDRLAAAPKSANPFLFSLANVQVQGGAIQFDDQVVGQHIQIDALQLGLPFVSNFPASTNIFVLPSFSAKVNGAVFSLKGRSKPFVDSLDTSLAIDVDHLDLASYVAYLPLPLPLQIESAKLTTKLDLVFRRQRQQTELLLSGDVQLDALSLKDTAAQPLLRIASLQTHVKQFNLLNAAAKIDQLRINAPEVWLALDAQGRWNWPAFDSVSNKKNLPSKQADDEDKNRPVSLAAATQAKQASPMAATTPAKPDIFLANLVLQNGQVHWSDAQHGTPAQLIQLSDIKLSARQISTAVNAKPAAFLLNAQAGQGQTLAFDGEFLANSGDVKGKLSLGAVQLESYQAYLNRVVAANLSGRLSLTSQVSLQQGQLLLDDGSLQLDAVILIPHAKNEGQVAIQSLAVDKFKLSTTNRSASAASVLVSAIDADIRRDAQSRLSLQKLMLPGTSTPASAVSTASTSIKPAPADWNLTLGHIAVTGSRFAFHDQTVKPAVNIEADALSFSADNLRSDLAQAMSMTLLSRLNHKGKVSLAANVSPQLKTMTLDVDAQVLPVAALSAYFSHLLNVEVLRGTANAKGRAIIRDPGEKSQTSNLDGMLSLNDFQILGNGEAEDFLHWKSIQLEGINASIGAGKPTVSLKKLALNDFYARLILSDKGKLNLRNIVAQENPAASDLAIASSTTPSTTPSTALITGNAVNSITLAPALTEVQSQAGLALKAATPVSSAAPIAIRIAQTTLRGGNINFTDNFIKPNYKANLTGLAGTIGAISSDNPLAAKLELSGKIDNDAPLLISGSVNPLSSPIFIDINGSASGIQLTRLTQYAAKYAGYAIEKGQLSMQVTYHVENQQLRAENEVRLDQLSFGEKIDSPDATSLPVNLALALLRDNNGKIAINLPISGSLSDPQFSVGGIIVKVFVNLISKAITAPFSLLGAAFGGGDELAYVEFAPGQFALTPAASGKLDSLTNALTARAGLKLDITGRIDPQTDTEGLRKESMDKKIRLLKLRDMKKKNPSIDEEMVVIDASDRQSYIEEVYQAEKFAKPRNLIGIAKTLATEQAMALILSNIVITPENLDNLAQRRADTVRDYLLQKGGINRERLFLTASKLHGNAISDKGSANRVDFSLN